MPFGSSRRPSQSSSWRSESHASAPARSVHLDPQRVLAAGRDLGEDDRPARAVLEAQQDVREVVRRDDDVLPLGLAGCGEGLDLADRPLPRRNHRCEVGEQLDDTQPGHELRSVEPVRADVHDRAQLTRAVDLEAPVPVGRVRSQSCKYPP